MKPKRNKLKNVYDSIYFTKNKARILRQVFNPNDKRNKALFNVLDPNTSQNSNENFKWEI
jgi:hypothetical protein